MGILQGIFAWLQKSVGKLVKAIFGWAVTALFVNVSEEDKTLASVVVGAAAVWPLLLVGVPFPKLAALVVAFVPLPKWVPQGWIRPFWIVAALLVPTGVGTALTRIGEGHWKKNGWKSWLSGFPVTLGIAAAFLTAFVTAPIRRLVALARRREQITIPLLLEKDDYEAAAAELRACLDEAGFSLRPADPPDLLTAPARVLRATGGRMLRDRIPTEQQFYRGPDLDVMVVPSAVTLEGPNEKVARAHGLACEHATFGPGLQTTAPEAQALERRIKDVWKVFVRERSEHRGAASLRSSLESLSREFAETTLDFDDWEILYREISQVSREVEGESQLLEVEKEESMTQEHENRREPAPGARPPAWPPRPGRAVRSLPTSQLIAGLTGELKTLVRTEIHLATAEMKYDLKAEMKSVTRFGIAAVLALVMLNLFFVAAALWLANVIAPPLAALVVAGVVLILAAVFAALGKAALKKPLVRTRKAVRESVSWAKNRVA